MQTPGLNMKNHRARFIPLTLAALALQLAVFQTAVAQIWVTNGPLNVARWMHTATLLTNGQVLIAGGLIYNVGGDSQDTNACELYDPSTGTSSFTGSMTYTRHQHTATLLTNGQVL